MNALIERASKIAAVPGVRAGLLVEAINTALVALSRRDNLLTQNMRAAFTFVDMSKVHFSLFINGERQGLYRFSYDHDGFAAPKLRKLLGAGKEDPPDEKTLSLERLFAQQLAKAQDGIWRTAIKPLPAS